MKIKQHYLIIGFTNDGEERFFYRALGQDWFDDLEKGTHFDTLESAQSSFEAIKRDEKNMLSKCPKRIESYCIFCDLSVVKGKKVLEHDVFPVGDLKYRKEI